MIFQFSVIEVVVSKTATFITLCSPCELNFEKCEEGEWDIYILENDESSEGQWEDLKLSALLKIIFLVLDKWSKPLFVGGSMAVIIKCYSDSKLFPSPLSNCVVKQHSPHSLSTEGQFFYAAW